MYTMDRCASVEGLSERVPMHIGSGNFTNHMEVDWITTKLESLPNIEELNILYATGRCLVTWGVEHDRCTVLVNCGVL